MRKFLLATVLAVALPAPASAVRPMVPTCSVTLTEHKARVGCSGSGEYTLRVYYVPDKFHCSNAMQRRSVSSGWKPAAVAYQVAIPSAYRFCDGVLSRR